MGISLLRTACNQYTIETGNSGLTYIVTIANVDGGYTQSWDIVDNANVTINFTIDGAYTFTASNGALFFSVDIPSTRGNCDPHPDTNTYAVYEIPSQYVAPVYTGYEIIISLPTIFSLTYTILNTDTSISVLIQNIAIAINALAISGLSASVVAGTLIINTPSDIELPCMSMTITAPPYTQTLWSTCALWNCIQYLINKIFCCTKGRCEEHTKEMQKERDELNRILLLYGQFSMMNDDERWDYLPLNLATNIQNDIFDKLNVITARCAHCCKDYKHHHNYENNSGCDECGQVAQTVQEWCQKLPPEAVTIPETNATIITS